MYIIIMPKDISKYSKEREEILLKIFNILGINEHNNHFEIKKIDEDIEMQNKILELEPDIKKYFNCGNWTCNKYEAKRKYLSFIRYILRDMNYSLISKRKMIDKTTYKKETHYYIFKESIF